MPNKNNKILVKLFKIAFWLVLVTVLVLGVAYTLLRWNTYQQLQSTAVNRAKEMTSLFNNGITAKPYVAGNLFTVNNDANVSAMAKIDYLITGPFNQIEPQTYKQFYSKGFRREGTDEKPFYTSGAGPNNSSWIQIHYVNDDEEIRVYYIFNAPYACANSYVCGRTADTSPDAKVYPLDSYGVMQVSSVEALYSKGQNLPYTAL